MYKEKYYQREKEKSSLKKRLGTIFGTFFSKYQKDKDKKLHLKRDLKIFRTF